MRAVGFYICLLFLVLKLDARAADTMRISKSPCWNLGHAQLANFESTSPCDNALDQSSPADNDTYLLCEADDDDDDVNLLTAKKYKSPVRIVFVYPNYQTVVHHNRSYSISSCACTEISRKYILLRTLII